jgi:hypothetical protein
MGRAVLRPLTGSARTSFLRRSLTIGRSAMALLALVRHASSSVLPA